MNTKDFDMFPSHCTISRLCFAVDKIKQFQSSNNIEKDIELCLQEFLLDKPLAIILFDKVNSSVVKTIGMNFPADKLKMILENKQLTSNFSQFTSALKASGCSNFSVVTHGDEDFDRRHVSMFCLINDSGFKNEASASALKIMAPHLHTAVANRYRNDLIAVSDKHPLSVRELEILHWVSKGKTNYEIGFILEISAYTVKNHISNILSKLQVSNRAQALEKCMSLGYFWS